MKNARTAPAINLKVPVELKKYLQHRAIDNHRSLNSEVIVRLESTVAVDSLTAKQQVAKQ